MTGLSAIRLMYRLAHRSMSELIEGLTEQEWLWTPSDGANPIAWIACHIGLWQDKIVQWLSRGAWTMTERFAAFDTGSDPQRIDQWPSILETRVYLENVQAALLSTLEKADDSFLEVELPPANGISKPATPKVILPYLLEHQIEHVGQISFLRKLMGKRGGRPDAADHPKEA